MRMEEQPNAHKVYVKVRADFELDGQIRPLKIRTAEGEPHVIDQILDVRVAPAKKAGGIGLRYTCRIGDCLFYLFNEQKLWFVER